MSTRLEGRLETDSGPAFMGAFPWDDGEHTFEAAHLAQFAVGPAAFSASVQISGPAFGLPDSWVQSTQASSEVKINGTLVLE